MDNIPVKIIREKRKSLICRFESKELIIRVPFFCNQNTIDNFVKRVYKKYANKFAYKSITEIDFINNQFYLLGSLIKINIDLYAKKQNIELSGDHLNIFLKKEVESYKVEKLIYNWISEHAKLYVHNILEDLKNLGFPIKIEEWTFKCKHFKSRWAHCNNVDKELVFAFKLFHLPLDIVRYVIVHEMCHIKHPHHQKAFWDEVIVYFPKYKEAKQKLQNYFLM